MQVPGGGRGGGGGGGGGVGGRGRGWAGVGKYDLSILSKIIFVIPGGPLKFGTD